MDDNEFRSQILSTVTTHDNFEELEFYVDQYLPYDIPVVRLDDEETFGMRAVQRLGYESEGTTEFETSGKVVRINRGGDETSKTDLGKFALVISSDDEDADTTADSEKCKNGINKLVDFVYPEVHINLDRCENYEIADTIISNDSEVISECRNTTQEDSETGTKDKDKDVNINFGEEEFESVSLEVSEEEEIDKTADVEECDRDVSTSNANLIYEAERISDTKVKLRTVITSEEYTSEEEDGIKPEEHEEMECSTNSESNDYENIADETTDIAIVNPKEYETKQSNNLNVLTYGNNPQPSDSKPTANYPTFSNSESEECENNSLHIADVDSFNVAKKRNLIKQNTGDENKQKPVECGNVILKKADIPERIGKVDFRNIPSTATPDITGEVKNVLLLYDDKLEKTMSENVIQSAHTEENILFEGKFTNSDGRSVKCGRNQADVNYNAQNLPEAEEYPNNKQKITFEVGSEDEGRAVANDVELIGCEEIENILSGKRYETSGRNDNDASGSMQSTTNMETFEAINSELEHGLLFGSNEKLGAEQIHKESPFSDLGIITLYQNTNSEDSERNEYAINERSQDIADYNKSILNVKELILGEHLTKESVENEVMTDSDVTSESGVKTDDDMTTESDASENYVTTEINIEQKIGNEQDTSLKSEKQINDKSDRIKIDDETGSRKRQVDNSQVCENADRNILPHVEDTKCTEYRLSSAKYRSVTDNNDYGEQNKENAKKKSSNEKILEIEERNENLVNETEECIIVENDGIFSGKGSTPSVEVIENKQFKVWVTNFQEPDSPKICEDDKKVKRTLEEYQVSQVSASTTEKVRKLEECNYLEWTVDHEEEIHDCTEDTKDELASTRLGNSPEDENGKNGSEILLHFEESTRKESLCELEMSQNITDLGQTTLSECKVVERNEFDASKKLIELGKCKKIEGNNRPKPKYFCKICNKEFGNLVLLRKHSRNCHVCEMPLDLNETYFRGRKKPNSQVCKECFQTFITKQSASCHMIQNTLLRPYNCFLCKAFFRDLCHILKHLTDHRKEIALFKNCSKCKEFNNMSSKREILTTHIVKHRQFKQCVYCLEHVLLKHSCNPLVKVKDFMFLSHKPLTCHGCKLKFFNIRYLRKHVMSSHLGSRPFVCSKCGMEFASKFILRKHIEKFSKYVREVNATSIADTLKLLSKR